MASSRKQSAVAVAPMRDSGHLPMKQIQPLANIVLKQDKIGNSVVRKNVTPAEVMFLCALHFKNAGDNPVIKIDIADDDREEKQIEPLKAEIDKLEARIAKDMDDLTITEEIREKRVSNLQAKLERARSQVADLEQIRSIRFLSPDQEKLRLGFRYNNIVLNKFYPGEMPSLPVTFDQAMSFGTRRNTSNNQFDYFLVGADRLQGQA